MYSHMLKKKKKKPRAPSRPFNGFKRAHWDHMWDDKYPIWFIKLGFYQFYAERTKFSCSFYFLDHGKICITLEFGGHNEIMSIVEKPKLKIFLWCENKTQNKEKKVKYFHN